MNILNFFVSPAHAGVMEIIRDSQPSEFSVRPGSTIADILTGNYIRFGGLNLILLAFVIIGILFMFNIIIAGWEYVSSSGDPKKFAAASTRFLNGFIGLGVAFLAFLIVNIITNMIGLGSLL